MADTGFYFEWCWNSRHTSEVLSHTFLTHLRARRASPECWRCRLAEMGTTFTKCGIPWALAFPLRKHGISVEPHNRQSRSPIPCGIQWWFLYRAIHESRHAPTKLGGSRQIIFRNCHNQIFKFGIHLVELSIHRGCYISAFRLFCNCDWWHKTSTEKYPRISIPEQNHSHLKFRGR